jgi:hypothetical protein
MPIDKIYPGDIAAITRLALRQCDATDRKLIARLALTSWLDTLAPEEQPGALVRMMADVHGQLSPG